MASCMPRSDAARKTCAASRSARFQALRSVCCEPTWKETPCAHQPKRGGMRQDVDGFAHDAAELAGERPFRAGAVGQDAAEDLGARRGARDLLHFLHAVDREEADAERIGARDVALFLDGVAVGDALRCCAGREHHLDLGDGGGVEGGAEGGEEAQDLRRRIGLHRVEDAAVGHEAGESFVVLADDIEVDHEAGAIGSSLVQERADAVGHHRAKIPVSKRCSPGVLRRPPPRDGNGSVAPGSPNRQKPGGSRRTALGRTEIRLTAIAWSGKARSARPAKRVCASSVSPAFGGPAETKKARHRRCFKPPVKTLGRPQARANLGKARSMRFALKVQGEIWREMERGTKKEGRPGPPPPIAPRSDLVEILVQSPRARIGHRVGIVISAPRAPSPPLNGRRACVCATLCQRGNTLISQSK